MPPTTQEEEPIHTFLDDANRRREFETALAEVAPELHRFEEELDECERLNEEDFAVRINARD
jgi:hypothetical protein